MALKYFNVWTFGNWEGRANSINNNGVIAGWLSEPVPILANPPIVPQRHAVYWPSMNDRPVDIGPGGISSEATDVNNAGTVVGIMTTASGSVVAFRWTPTEGLTALPGLPGQSGSYASAVDDNGTIVGWAVMAGCYAPVRWRTGGRGGVSVANLIAGTNGCGRAMDVASGQDPVGIVGYPPCIPCTKSVRFTTSGARVLPGWGTRYTEPTGISPLGRVIGITQDWADRSYTTDPLGVSTELGVPPRYRAYMAWGLNRCGVIVGAEGDVNTGSQSRALIWDASRTDCATP